MTDIEAVGALKWKVAYAKEIGKSHIDGVYVEALDLAVKALEEKEADRWIPVSERLPEEKLNPNMHDFKEVQCTTIWGDVRVYKFGREIGYDTAHFWHRLRIMDEYIVAWKPLSKPYESEDSE